ncbi:F-box/LRR-repeat protein At3g26922 [Linum grandiflorum]
MTNPRLRKDRISSLPDGVREHILHFLPLKEAGKASILSSEWRNLWMNLPTLKFDQEFDTEGKGDVKKLMLDICRVLLLHREPEPVIDEANDVSPLEMLRHMTLSDLCLSTPSHVYSLLLMIKSSPNLQRLEITMQPVKRKTSASVISFDGPSKFELSQLRKVEVKNLKGTENELAFIKWLLSSSPALDIMKIHLSSKLSDAKKILTLAELNGFARPSTKALIKIESLDWN